MVKWKLYVVISALFNEINVIIHNATDMLLEIIMNIIAEHNECS